MTMNLAVGYVRVSTSNQDCSIEMQIARIKAYCNLMGLTLCELLVENDVSGKTRIADRPEGGRIDSVIARGARHVVALKLDRLFRNAADALMQTDDWQARGCALHLIDMGGQSINTASAMGKMMLTVLAGFAEFERATIVERTTAALRHKKATGKVFNHVPFGKRCAVAGMLVDDPAEQQTIGKVRALRSGGMSFQRIADLLNSDRVPSKKGGLWYSQSVKNMIAA